MSSHREAPQISKNPTADNTDVYAFVSPDEPDTVTLIANYIPLELPDGGPNFYELSDDVAYEINVDNDGDGIADITYQFRFTTVNNDPSSFLYNDGPITSLTPPGAGSSWNRQQVYSLTRVDRAGPATLLGQGLLCPPCNVGPRSTPDYAALAAQAVHSFAAGGYSGTCFAGQRAEGFYVDLGSVFDLGGLRPFNSFHEGPPLLANMPGVDSTAALNVHSLALQVPITDLTADGRMPASTTAPTAVIGVWATASMQRAQMIGAPAPMPGPGGPGVPPPGPGRPVGVGPFTQVSRLGNPLVNEVIIGIGDKDAWNMSPPSADGVRFFSYFANPLLARLLPDLYPGAFDELAAYERAHTGTTPAAPARPDIVAILLTGIPQSVLEAAGVAGVVPPTNVGGKGVGDMLRLNVAQPPTSPRASSFSIFGYLEGDGAGYPNGRRVYDDVATIALRAVAGATLPLVTSFTPDAVVGTIGTDPNKVISFGLTTGNSDITVRGTEAYLSSFPYLGTPYSGYATPSSTPTDKGI